jgi:putative inorganic carbon (HCO3(-)) transporter
VIEALKSDIKSFKQGLSGQDAAFYLGLFFIVLYYLSPHQIFPQLDILPWFKITILLGLFIIVIKGDLRFTKIHSVVFLFAFLAMLSAVTSLYPSISREKITTPLIFALEVLFFASCIKNTKQLKLVLIVYFLCLFKMSFFGARTWAMGGFSFSAWGIQGPPGFFQNSGEYSLLMALAAAMSIPFILAMQPKTKLYWILPITASMSVMGASSRGSQLALVVGFLYLIVSYKKLRLKNLIYVIIIASVVWALIPVAQKTRFETAGDDETSTARIGYWKAGIEMAREHPWIGIGFNAFPVHYHNFYAIKDGSFLSKRWEAAHNSFIQVVSTLGLPAFILYLIMHFQIYQRESSFFENTNNETDKEFLNHFRMGLNASIITYAVGSFFMSITFYPYIYFLLSLAVVKRQLMYKQENLMRGRRQKRKCGEPMSRSIK